MKCKTKNVKELPLQTFIQLKKIFEDNNWSIKNDFDIKTTEFDRFCDLLQGLVQEEQSLLLELTKKFLRVDEFEYMKYFASSFNSFVDNYEFQGRKNLIIVPLLPECDFGKSKSSTFLIYFIKAKLQELKTRYDTFDIKVLDAPQYIDVHNASEAIVCLVDDFVGSGETADAAIDYLNGKGLLKEQIAILSLVAMNQGKEFLNRKGYSIFAERFLPKAITDNGENFKLKKDIMLRLEEKIKVKEKYSLGYNNTEALVKMMRTPNNTFPIFWLKRNNPNAPFPR